VFVAADVACAAAAVGDAVLVCETLKASRV
jgi:uncharacterized MnhB-related membrane protein